MRPVQAYLEQLADLRRAAILAFHQEYRPQMAVARGSRHKHQAWPGGYLDHIGETLRIAEQMYPALSALRPLPFTLDSAYIVLYFHDVEKLWKYSSGLPAGYDNETYLFQTLAVDNGITFTDDEVNALCYIHGESAAEHTPDCRLMGQLASFCHAADNLSARLWYDEGRGLG